jgi:hypothetical protein
MAQKQSSPKEIGSALDAKFRHRVARLASRARYTISNDFNLGEGLTGSQTLLSKSFASDFFKSEGDSLEVVLCGTLKAETAESVEFLVEFEDEAGTSLGSVLATPTINGLTTDISFHGIGSIYLDPDKTLGGAGTFISSYSTTPISISRFLEVLPLQLRG